MTAMSDRVLIQPDSQTLVASRHPNHELGDAVSLSYTDMQTGEQHLWVIPLAVADYLSSVFASAVRSPAVNAAADRVREAQS
jgi:hypothetical protein